MKIDIGRHLFIQISIICMQFIGMYLLDVIRVYSFGYDLIVPFLLSTCLIISVFNTIYIGRFVVRKYNGKLVKNLYILFSLVILITFFC